MGFYDEEYDAEEAQKNDLYTFATWLENGALPINNEPDPNSDGIVRTNHPPHKSPALEEPINNSKKKVQFNFEKTEGNKPEKKTKQETPPKRTEEKRPRIVLTFELDNKVAQLELDVSELKTKLDQSTKQIVKNVSIKYKGLEKQIDKRFEKQKEDTEKNIKDKFDPFSKEVEEDLNGLFDFYQLVDAKTKKHQDKLEKLEDSISKIQNSVNKLDPLENNPVVHSLIVQCGDLGKIVQSLSEKAKQTSCEIETYVRKKKREQYKLIFAFIIINVISLITMYLLMK